MLFRSQSDGTFATIREVLVFAAAFGYTRGIRQPFVEASEPVRWDTMTKSAYFEAIVDMICAAESDVRPEFLADDYLDDRVSVFEEYANGGLELLQKELRNAYGRPLDILTSLIASALRDDPDADDLSVKQLADELLW